VDLAAVHAVLPQESHEAFLREYGRVSRTAWSAARARAGWHTVALLAHASDSDDVDMIEEAQQALGRLVNTGSVAPPVSGKSNRAGAVVRQSPADEDDGRR
jgi:hypothetical protein